MNGEGPYRDYADSHLASYEHHPVEDIEPQAELPLEIEDAAQLIAEVVRWVAEPYARGPGPHTLFITGTRAAILQFVLNADAFRSNEDGRQVASFAAIAISLGMSKQALGKHVADFRKRFPQFNNRVFRTAVQRERMRQAALEHHAKKEPPPGKEYRTAVLR